MFIWLRIEQMPLGRKLLGLVPFLATLFGGTEEYFIRLFGPGIIFWGPYWAFWWLSAGFSDLFKKMTANRIWLGAIPLIISLMGLKGGLENFLTILVGGMPFWLLYWLAWWLSDGFVCKPNGWVLWIYEGLIYYSPSMIFGRDEEEEEEKDNDALALSPDPKHAAYFFKRYKPEPEIIKPLEPSGPAKEFSSPLPEAFDLWKHDRRNRRYMTRHYHEHARIRPGQRSFLSKISSIFRHKKSGATGRSYEL